jgi:hypothetical protein
MHTKTARRILQTFLAPLLLALALEAPPFTNAAATFPTPPAPTAEAAVALAAAGSGSGYAGDCAATRSPDDIGKACSKSVAQRGNARAYLIGRTFSEFSAWVFVQQNAAGWQLIGTQHFDGSMSSPTVPWPAQAADSGGDGPEGAA